MKSLWHAALALIFPFAFCSGEPSVAVDATTIRHKVMCGYQGWFNAPGDGSNLGWVHWSRDPKRITPNSLTFEMWPDMTEYSESERFPAPGFTYPDGQPAHLYSANNPDTIRRHFSWMREYGIDGAWLQRFVVDLPGLPVQSRYQPLLNVLRHVQEAARRTGRAWALTYDVAGAPRGQIFDALVADWKRMVEDNVTRDPRYLHEGGAPVVQIWGFYYKNKSNLITPEVGSKLIDFFKAPGPYHAYLVGGGDWDSATNPSPEWQAMFRRFDAYAPWNIGNKAIDAQGVAHASMGWWKSDRQAYESRGQLWIPTLYAGFGWDNMMRIPPGTSNIPRRGGKFLWEQFHELSKLGGIDTIYLSMFDEVDEGTAIFKVTSAPPTQAHFVGYEGMPSDWYLRLVGLGETMLREKRPIPAEIPIKP